MFEIFHTDEARKQLDRLKTDKGLEKRHKAVKKATSKIAACGASGVGVTSPPLHVESRNRQKQKNRVTLLATRLSKKSSEIRGFPSPDHSGFGFIRIPLHIPKVSLSMGIESF